MCIRDSSKSVSKKFNKRELDVLLTSGEQVTSALMAGALNDLGVKSKSWMNWQVPILTEGEHTNSRIVNIRVKDINDYLSKGGVVVIPGFQGISKSGDKRSFPKPYGNPSRSQQRAPYSKRPKKNK